MTEKWQTDFAAHSQTGFAAHIRRRPLDWYTGRENGGKYGLRGEQLERTRRTAGRARLFTVLHAREAVDQRDPPAVVPRAGPDLSGAGTRRVVFGTVSRPRLGSFHRSRR